MRIPRSRRGLAIGLAVTTAAIAIATVTLNGAYASHPGAAGSPLTTYNELAVHFADGTAIPAHSNFAEFAWSPDGSRFAYIDNTADAILSVRANDPDGDTSNAGGSAITLVDGLTGNGARHEPTWSADGSALYYTEEPTAGKPWTIDFSTSAAGWGDQTLTPADGMDYTWPDAGPTSVVVAQRQTDDGTGNPTGAPTVVVIDASTGTVTPVIDNASQPAVSPDGSHVAFMRSDGTNNQIWTSNMTGGDLTQITADAADHRVPTWSPDGTTIALISSASATGIATASATGSDAANPTPVSGIPFGEPAYQPLNKDHVVELAGSNRFGTAIDISKSHWATAGATGDNREAAKSVTLSRSDTFADAVSGSALAAAKHGPLLLTPPTSLDAGTKAEIKRVLGSTTATVYLLGGTGAISTTVENAIKTMGYTTKRLSGSDRYATSVAIAKAISANPALFLVATGRNFPDALSAGAAAGSYAASGTYPAVVILSNDSAMPSSTETYLESFVSGTTFNGFLSAIGGQADAALTKAGWKDYDVEAGPNRYVTAQKVAIEFFGGEQTAGVTTGLNWPDALAGGALLGTLNGPLLLTGASSTLDSNAQALLSDSSGSISTAFIFGGTLPSSINGQIGAAISGPAGFDANLPATASSKLKSAAGSSVIGSGSPSKLPANATKAKHKG